MCQIPRSGLVEHTAEEVARDTLAAFSAAWQTKHNSR
jgi:hypothetical protein